MPRPVRTNISGFVFQYNFIRGLRPKRNAKKTDIRLDENPGPKDFNYSIPECDPELFHTEKLGKRRSSDFLYNRYPFAPYHFLWVPNRKNKYHQFIDHNKDQEIIEDSVRFVTEEGLGSVRCAYNSLGAHASVNSLHEQGFFVTEDWEPPIEDYIRKGKVEKGLYFKGARWIPKKDMATGLIKNIKEMNERYYSGEKVAYAYYLTPDGAVFFPRKHQGNPEYFGKLENARMEEGRSPFTTGFAFFEMLGEILCPSIDAINVFDDRKEIIRKVRELYGSLHLQ